MITIQVDGSGKDFPDCPLRTDVNSCGAVLSSAINSCPIWIFEEDENSSDYELPDWCPLRDGGVLVRLKSGT